MKVENIISAFQKISVRLKGSAALQTDSGDIDDALQEAFCRLWSHRDTIADTGHAEGFLTMATRNIIADNHRQRSYHPECELDGREGEIPEESNDTVKDLYTDITALARQSLSERDMEILFKRERDGWDFDELALHYNLSESNVRMIVSRARKTLRTIYNSKHNR